MNEISEKHKQNCVFCLSAKGTIDELKRKSIMLRERRQHKRISYLKSREDFYSDIEHFRGV